MKERAVSGRVIFDRFRGDSFDSRQSGYGCALMSPRPKTRKRVLTRCHGRQS